MTEKRAETTLSASAWPISSAVSSFVPPAVSAPAAHRGEAWSGGRPSRPSPDAHRDVDLVGGVGRALDGQLHAVGEARLHQAQVGDLAPLHHPAGRAERRAPVGPGLGGHSRLGGDRRGLRRVEGRAQGGLAPGHGQAGGEGEQRPVPGEGLAQGGVRPTPR